VRNQVVREKNGFAIASGAKTAQSSFLNRLGGDMQRFILTALVAVLAFGCTPQPPAPPAKTTVDQGPAWTVATRAKFYSQDQGSQVIPLRWIKALNLPDGTPFLANNLARYGYLTNNEDPATILPAGFTAAGPAGQEVLGMTCAACHTRQIEVKGVPYRIDGGPAIADFQAFLRDLDIAVKGVIADPAAFHAFAATVLDQPATPAQEAALLADLKAWFLRYDTLIQKALPPKPWGVARLDAVAMIFDRLTGLDLGPAPSHLIPANIQVADAPVRYPFLWNAPIQDMTQWPGFAENGNDLFALGRNLGEVFGVFGTFYPDTKPPRPLLGVDYLKYNSANFDGLGALEDLVKQIGPPKFPWPIDAKLASAGQAIFQRECDSCHGIKPGQTRLIDQHTWATPILDVGTDSREDNLLQRKARTGVLAGAKLPGGTALKPEDTAFAALSVSVGGSILQRIIPVLGAPELVVRPHESLAAQRTRSQAATLRALTAAPETQEVQETFAKPPAASYKYESRVLQGIWAAAPYLHNGSVPTLADLLNPVAERPASFQVGPAYDIDRVGLAAVQTRFNDTLTTTDCADRNSGDSRCGHEYGTGLSADDKRALLEYLKQL